MDKNIQPSFKHFDNSTSSHHWIHTYAVKDRLDFSAYSDHFPTNTMNIKSLLVNDKDVAQLAIVLMSR